MFFNKKYIIVLFFLIGLLGSCTKVYHKRFIVDEKDILKDSDIGISLEDFNIWCFIDVALSSEKKPVDSTYRVNVHVEPNNKNSDKNKKLIKSFKIKGTHLEFYNGENIQCKEAKITEISDFIRSYDYEPIIIPENVKQINFKLIYDYLSDSGLVISDSVTIKLVKSEGHYTVPLGKFMN